MGALKRSCVAGFTVLAFLAEALLPVPTFLPIPRGLAPYSLTQAKYDRVVMLVVCYKVTFVRGGVRLQPLKLIQVCQELSTPGLCLF